MIKFGKKDTEQIFSGKKPIAFVYQGARLVWQAISSCFGSGSWSEDKPWSESDAWREN